MRNDDPRLVISRRRGESSDGTVGRPLPVMGGRVSRSGTAHVYSSLAISMQAFVTQVYKMKIPRCPLSITDCNGQSGVESFFLAKLSTKFVT